MTAVAVLAETFLGAGPPSAEWGGAIISSRWKNWGLDKSEGAEAPRPRPRTATGFPSKYCNTVWCGKTRIVWLPDGKIFF